MARPHLRSLACLIALVGCSGRGCRDRDDTAPDCAEADKVPWYADQDGDGHGALLSETWDCDAPQGHVTSSDDCDDAAAGWQTIARYADADADGFGIGDAVQVCETAPGFVDIDQDCDDADSDVHPGAPVTCGDDIDQDCDGASDCEAPTGAVGANQADAKILGDEAGTLGAALVAADLDGDGVLDLGVGAPEENDEGAAYVIYGPILGVSSTSDAGMRMGGKGYPAHIGAAVAVGDVDDDGDADLLVGAPDCGIGCGGVSTYIIKAPLPTLVEIEGENDPVRLTGAGASILVGYDYAGDDGVADIILGEGYASVFLKEGPTSRARDLTTSNDGSLYRGGELGQSLAFLGDVNGDGFADLGVGSPEDANGSEVPYTIFGNFYLIDGPEAFQVQAEDEDLPFWRAFVLGPEADGLFGWSVAPAGDQDDDGYADVAVGAPGVDGGAGAVYIYSGDALTMAGNEEPVLAEEALAKFSPADDAMQIGYSVSGGTDANGDGTPDLLLGAPGHDDGRGAAFLWYGPLLNDVNTDQADLTLTGETAGDTFGAAVNLLADMNALGRPDILVGATGVNDGDGAVYLFFTDGL